MNIPYFGGTALLICGRRARHRERSRRTWCRASTRASSRARVPGTGDEHEADPLLGAPGAARAPRPRAWWSGSACPSRPATCCARRCRGHRGRRRQGREESGQLVSDDIVIAIAEERLAQDDARTGSCSTASRGPWPRPRCDAPPGTRSSLPGLTVDSDAVVQRLEAGRARGPTTTRRRSGSG